MASVEIPRAARSRQMSWATCEYPSLRREAIRAENSVVKSEITLSSIAHAWYALTSTGSLKERPTLWSLRTPAFRSSAGTGFSEFKSSDLNISLRSSRHLPNHSSPFHVSWIWTAPAPCSARRCGFDSLIQYGLRRPLREGPMLIRNGVCSSDLSGGSSVSMTTRWKASRLSHVGSKTTLSSAQQFSRDRSD